MSEHKAITPESLWEMRWVSDPQIAPDGARVAYVEHWVGEIEKDGNKRKAYRSAIYLSESHDSPPRRLTHAPKGNDSVPRWSPDGRALAFISTRDDDKPQLFMLALDGGEAQAITRTRDLSEGVSEYDWHPSGTMLAFVSAGHKDDDAKQREVEHDEKVYEGRLPIKFDGKGLFSERRPQIYRINRDGSGCKRLTDLKRDVGGITWSPDGRRLVFVSKNEQTPEYAWINDLFVIGADSGEPRQITPGGMSLSNPSWSPDGSQIAFLGHDRRRGNASTSRVWTVTLEDRATRCLTEGFQGQAGGIPTGDSHLGVHPLRPAWNTQGGLTFAAMVHGRTGLYHVPLDGGEVEQINTSGLSVVGFTQRADTIAFVGETNTRSGEVFTSQLGHGLHRRSHAADGFFRAYAISAPEHLRFKGADGWDLEGWVIRPTGDAPHPLIIYVHGGPHLAYGNAFAHEFQALVAAGFGVFFTNPRGSSSYGEEFADAVRGHFGEKDYEDIMAAADLAASWDWVDSRRMGIMGGSYGGFMTNWVITHTDRFAAACTQRSISNLYSFAGTSDIGPEFSRDEYGGLPWTDEELLMSRSPMRYVQNITTPTLILHQEEDHRCPIEQAEQLYTALVVLGVPTKLVRFPGEGHELPRSGQPQRRVNRMSHIIDWFTRYLIDGAA